MYSQNILKRIVDSAFFRSLLVASLSPLIVFSQTDTDEDDPIFELNPFEVKTDQISGYVSSNVLSAYRVNATIKEVPFNIQVVTDEFLKDQGAVNLDDAVQYSAGVTIGGTDASELDRFNIRGLQAARPKRNGYRRYYASDMTNVQQVEIVKGPASAIFGEAQPGGIVNYITKRPQKEPSSEIIVQAGTWDHYRVQWGSTGPVRKGDDRLLYRFDASWQSSDGYRDFVYEERIFFAPVLSWQPTEKTKILIDGEYVQKKFNPPSRNFLWNEEATAAFWEEWAGFVPEDWNDLPELTTQFLEDLKSDPVKEILFRLTENPSATPKTDGETRWTGLYPLVPLTTSSTGPDTFYDYETVSVTAEVQHTFSDAIDFRFVASHADITTDAIRSDTSRVRVWGDGLQQGKRLVDRKNKVSNVQADMILKAEFWGIKNRFIFGTEYMIDDFSVYTIRSRVEPATVPSQLVVLFEESIPLFLNYDLVFPTEEKLIVGENRISLSEFFDEFGDPLLVENDSATKRELTSYYFSHQMSIFRDSLKVLYGFRHDSVKQTFKRDAFASGDRPDLPYSETQTSTTPQLGINWYVTGDLVLYTNYSKSFTPTEGLLDNLDGSSSPKPPEKGEGLEFGLKFGLLDGRISGTLAYFDITKEDVARRFISNEGEPYSALIDGQKSEGWELDLVAYPIPSLQFIFGYAYIQSEELVGEGALEFDRRIPGVPEHQVTFWSKYTFLDGFMKNFEIGFGATYLGERRGWQTNRDLLFLESYTRYDALIGYSIERDSTTYKLQLKLENITDEIYFRPGPYVGDPFNANLTFTIQF